MSPSTNRCDHYHPAMAGITGNLSKLVPVVIAIVCAITQVSRAQDELPAISNDDHAWTLTAGSEPGPRFNVLHLAGQQGSLGFARLQGISQAPEELIAWRDRFYAVFPPSRSDDDGTDRQVLSIQVVHNEPLDVYYALPRGRFRLEPGLPATGEVVASTATSHGPTVLLVEHARRVPPNMGSGVETDTPLPALLELRANGWRRIDLPTGALIDRTTRLAAAGNDNQTLLLLTPGQSGDRTRVWRRTGESEWTSDSLELDLDRVERITQLGDQAIIAIDAGASSIDVAYLRHTRTMRIATITRPTERWNVVAGAGRLFVVSEQPDADALRSSEIDVNTGAMGDWHDINPHETGQFKVWLTSLLIAAAMSAVLLFALLRPIRPAPVTRERNIRLAPLSLRAAALLIDLIPATVPTLLITRCSLMDLTAVPLLIADFFEAGPFFVMTGFMLIHATAGEVLTGRTLGKYIMGVRIVGQMVDDVRAYEVVLRNIGKAVALAVPPLLLIVAMNPNLQGLGDIMGRTLVVRPRRSGAITDLQDPTDRSTDADDQGDS